jgi:hypothetical protein
MNPPHPSSDEIFRRLLDESSAVLGDPVGAGIEIPDDDLHREILLPLLPAMLGDGAIRKHWHDQAATGFLARLTRHLQGDEAAPQWQPADFEIHVTASYSAGPDARALADTLLSEESLRDMSAALMNQVLAAVWPRLELPAVEVVPAEVEAAAAPLAAPLAEPLSQPAAESIVEAVAAHTAEPAGEPAEPIAEPISEPVAASTAEPLVEAVAEPGIATVNEPVAEIVAEPAVEPAPESAAETVVEPAPRFVGEPVAETVVEPAPSAEPAIEPVPAPELAVAAEAATPFVSDAEVPPVPGADGAAPAGFREDPNSVAPEV